MSGMRTLLKVTKAIVCSIIQRGSCVAYLIAMAAVLMTCMKGASLHAKQSQNACTHASMQKACML